MLDHPLTVSPFSAILNPCSPEGNKGDSTLSEHLEWSDLYLAWEILMETGWNQGLSFTPLNYPPYGKYQCDWWPTQEITERRAALDKRGAYGIYWTTGKGTLHTINLLYKSSSDPETQAAILVAASAWDTLNSLPTAWRGATYRLIEDIMLAIVFASQGPFREHALNPWHSAMRHALPVNIATEEFAEFSKPRRYSDFIHVAFVEAALSTSLWTPVVFSPRLPNP